MVDPERAISACNPAIARIVEKPLPGGEITVGEAEELFTVSGVDLEATLTAADHLRRQVVGEESPTSLTAISISRMSV